MVYRPLIWRLTNRNGQISRRKLRQIEPPQYDADIHGPALMHPEAAAAMSALLRDAPSGLKVKYAYRTLSTQWVKYNAWRNGSGNLAAYPGTSNHGWAVSVDFTGMSSQVIWWLRANALRYGYTNDVPSEIWHYTYMGGWEGESDDMTPEQKKKLNEALSTARETEREVAQILSGMTAFLQSEAEPAREGIVRKTWRAFTKAANH